MTPITVDIETYWTKDFSLSKISFMEYIKSPEFEIISLAMKVGSGPTQCAFGEHEVGRLLRSVDWSKCAMVGHNGNEFDFPALVWKYDVHPKLFVDTLCLSRPKHQSEVGGSLKKLSQRYNLPEKQGEILMQTQGKRLADFTAAELAEMERYNIQDVDNTYALFKAFKDGDVPESDDLRLNVAAASWSKKELLLSDMTARMIVYPQFVCDDVLLTRTLQACQIQKEGVLQEAANTIGVLTAEEAKTELASAKKCADVLRSMGVEPPTKISKTTGKETLAMAKTDEAFTALLEHEDPRVQAVVAARLDVKSTLLETRLGKMIKCSESMGGWMPVPLAYHSATTGRWGGRVWNPQNLPRIARDKQGNIIPKLTDALRQCLCAPEGYKVVVSDLSGIELRVNHYLWDVESTQYLYDQDPEADLYKEFAGALFGVPKDQVTKDQRQLAKVAQLGLGYGAGWRTFKKVAKIMGNIDLDDAEAERVTLAWRTKYSDIVNGWKKCQTAIVAMYQDAEFRPDPRGLCLTDKDSIWLPSGRKLHYPNLRIEADPESGIQQFIYGEGKNRSKVYSGLMDENLVQAIARDVIAEQAIYVYQSTGYWPAHMVHDELVYVVPEAEADSHMNTLNKIMRTPPTWLPGIVLWSEGDIAYTYGDAK